MKTLLIADDLTGALDSAAAFALRGMTVVCALGPGDVRAALSQNPDLLAVTTNSREISESMASSRVEQVLDAVRADPRWRDAVLIKKIDSRLKGNLMAEVVPMARLRADVLVCPAIPRLGRVVKSGALSGAGVTVPVPLSARLCLPGAYLPDAGNDADIDAAVAGADLTGTLFVGAAGLAEALARRLVPHAPEIQAPDTQFRRTQFRDSPPMCLRAPAVFAIGSRDPVTLAQLARFTPVAAPDGHVPALRAAALNVVQMTPGAGGCGPVDPAAAGAQFAAGIAAWVRDHPPATLLACGGETAAAILRELGIGLLRVEGEALAGVPVSCTLDGIAGLRIVTKSGGFGDADTLRALGDMLTAPLPDCV